MANILMVIVSVFAILSCIRFTETKVEEDNLFQSVSDNTFTAIEGSSKSIAIENYNNGVIADFNNGVKNNWWGSDKIVLSSKNDALVINISDAGLSYDRFGHRFNTFCDFSAFTTIRVRARSEGKSIPVLRIDLKDANGFSTNHVDTKTRILICDTYVDYFFKFDGKFEQGWPTRNIVDKKRISELELFINPGGPEYSGTIFIDDITIVKKDEMAPMLEKTCTIQLQNNAKVDMKYWWVNNNKYTLSYDEENAGIEINSRGAGVHYESFGRGFVSTSFTKNSVLKLKIKAEGVSSPDFRLDLVDADGIATNGVAIIKTIPNDNQYRDYYFDYKDKFYQGWPQTKRVDEKSITELMFFINPGGIGYYGNVTISEIELVNDFVRKSENTNATLYTNENMSLLNFENFDLWWTGKGAKINNQINGLEIKIDSTTMQEVVLGSGFDSKNLSFVNQLKVLVKSTNHDFKISLFDEKGNVTDKVIPFKSISREDGDRKSTRLNSSHLDLSRMPSSA